MFDTPISQELSEESARVRTMARLADVGARTLAGTDASELSSEDLRDLTT